MKRAPQPGPRRTRPIARRLAALLIGLVATPLVGELAYRLIRVGGMGPTTNPIYVRHDDELGWAYRSGARGRHSTEEFDVAIEINSMGFRGDEWQLDQTGRRVLVLGDSFGFGWGVEESQSFSAQLRNEGWQVLNASVSGYGTGQQLLLLRQLADQLRPDLVVCVFCANDLYENGASQMYGKNKPWFRLEGGALELSGQPVPQPWLERVSMLYRAFAKLLWERRFARARRDGATEWRLQRELYLEMRRELDPEVELLLVSREDRLAELTREESGIDHLDIRAPLDTVRERTSFAVDGHWNAAGHAAVARALAERIRTLEPD